MELEDSRFIIAGATGALGSGIARELAARGADVGLLGRDRQRLDEVAAELGDVPTASFDATDTTSCQRAVDAVAAALGGLDGLVVTVGVPAFGEASATSDAVCAELMAVNALGPISLLRAGAAHFDGGGALAAVTALVADHPTAGLAAYSASKAALSAYLTAIRREVRRQKITVLDARLPHLDTAFAERALAGTPPGLPEPYSADDAVQQIVDAIAAGRREIAWNLGARELLVK